MTGLKIGKLTVLKEVEKSKSDRIKWTCKCECGNIKNIHGYYLRKHSAVSCGCSKKHVGGKENPLWKGCQDLSTRYFRNTKRRAIKKNLEFNITIEQMWEQFTKQNGKCALSGVELKFPKHSSKICTGNASIDRIDSSKGYTVNNIQWVDKKINQIKMDMNEEEFIKRCKQITEYQKIKNPQENILGISEDLLVCNC